MKKIAKRLRAWWENPRHRLAIWIGIAVTNVITGLFWNGLSGTIYYLTGMLAGTFITLNIQQIESRRIKAALQQPSLIKGD